MLCPMSMVRLSGSPIISVGAVGGARTVIVTGTLDGHSGGSVSDVILT